MKKIKRNILIFFLLISLSTISIAKVKEYLANNRAGVITINAAEQFGPLERPPVTFLHGKHVSELAKQNKDCNVCHLTDSANNEYRSLKFLRNKETGKQEIMDLYHAKCVECHKERSDQGLEAGPATTNECGICHIREPKVSALRQDVELDKSLHYRHVKAHKDKCDKCHHEYNEKNKKIYYAKGQERSCRDCHIEEDSLSSPRPLSEASSLSSLPLRERARVRGIKNSEISSMRTASHKQCISCHKINASKNKDTGPVSCEGCHDRSKQLAYKKIKRVPRIKRNQPDIALVCPIDLKKGRMKTVPFNHKVHEQANDTCRACHHESLKACKDCHTVFGDDKAEGTTLAMSMHDMASKHSCVGCHNSEKVKTDCAGCHKNMKQGGLSDKNCQTCHRGPMPKTVKSKGKMSAHYLKMLAKRNYSKLSWNNTEIEKTIKISQLSEKYEPAIFPHRKIIDHLRKKIKKSNLAKTFHENENAMCLGCHHNNPADAKPAKCSHCHGKPFDSRNLDISMPGLKGAYHLQCMGCHTNMGLEKHNDCTTCHKEKKK
ncbi:sulfate respiration complex hexadecaheme cytochrome HmcA [Elusimicrobiota bacterium]